MGHHSILRGTPKGRQNKLRNDLFSDLNIAIQRSTFNLGVLMSSFTVGSIAGGSIMSFRSSSVAKIIYTFQRRIMYGRQKIFNLVIVKRTPEWHFRCIRRKKIVKTCQDLRVSQQCSTYKLSHKVSEAKKITLWCVRLLSVSCVSCWFELPRTLVFNYVLLGWSSQPFVGYQNLGQKVPPSRFSDTIQYLGSSRYISQSRADSNQTATFKEYMRESTTYQVLYDFWQMRKTESKHREIIIVGFSPSR